MLRRSGGMLRAQTVHRRPNDSIYSQIAPQTRGLHLLPLPIPEGEAASLQDRLKYRFYFPMHFNDALTHTSYPFRCRSAHLEYPWPKSPTLRSYKMLKFNGNFTLESRLTCHIFGTTPQGKDPDALCNVNLSPHKLARTALRLRLYNSLRHNSPKLDQEVNKFINLQQGKVPYLGIPPKVPDVLPDLFEAMFGAVMLDCECNHLKAWQTLHIHLAPIVYWDHMEQAVATLRDVCNRYKMRLDFKNRTFFNLTATQVFINTKLHGSGTSEVQAYAESIAAMDALNKLPNFMLYGTILDTPLSVKDKLGSF